MKTNELYSFDKVGNFSIIVEEISSQDMNPLYEGIVWRYAVNNPHAVEKGKDPEKLRGILIETAKMLAEEHGET